MQRELQAIEKAGIQVAAVSYDSVAILARFGRRLRISFPLLSDSDSKVIDAFGVRNESPGRPRWEGIPHPGTFLIDKKGIIRAKLPGTIMQRHSPQDLIAAAEKLKRDES